MANPNPKNKWQPGVSGNPKGRARKGKTLTDILEKHLRRRKEMPDGKRMSHKDILAIKLIELAEENDDTTALKYIYDRIDGKPTETVDTKHSGNIQIGIDRVIYDSVHGNDDTEADVDDEAD